MKKKKFAIIDAHSYIYRAYYAFIKNPLINSKGFNTSAIFGFSRYILKILRELNPDYIAVAYDIGKKTFRNRIYKAYKSGRPSMPDDLRQQIPIIINIIKVMNISLIGIEDYEADDIIATIVEKYKAKSIDFLLFTGDKDVYQLLDSNTLIYAPGPKSDFKILDKKSIIEKIGVSPELVIDYMALTGDSVDAIPGVKGIGPKTASLLINKYGSIDSIYEHIEEIKPEGIKKKLIQNKDNAYISRQLVAMNRNIELKYSLTDFLKPDNIYNKKLYEIFKEYELFSLLKILDKYKNTKKISKVADSNPITIIKLEAEVHAIIEKIFKEGIYALRFEITETQNIIDSDLIGISIAVKDKNFYIPIGFIGESLFENKGIKIDSLKELFEKKGIRCILGNYKIIYRILKKYNIVLNNDISDLLLYDFILDTSHTSSNSFDVIKRWLNISIDNYDDFLGTASKRMKLTDKTPQEIANFSTTIAGSLLKVYKKIKPIFEKGEDSIEKQELYDKVFLKTAIVLGEIEDAGIKINISKFSKISMELQGYIEDISAEIIKYAGHDININSPKQLQNLLFQELKLKPGKKIKTGFSTGVNVLMDMRNQHPIIPLILEYRKYSKLLNTYIKNFPLHVSPRTGRIHTTLHGTGASTGRLSSENPNLQNIPARDKWGKIIRSAFIAEDNYLIISGDYSQIELRVLASHASVKGLISAFKDDIDIHTRTAALIFGMKEADITKELRNKGKMINFSIIYGKQAFGLSRDLGISFSEAKEFIEGYFRAFPEIKEYMENCRNELKKNGSITIIPGLKRYFPEYNNASGNIKQSIERGAINTPIQGIASHIMKLAMIRVSDAIKNLCFKARLILQIHDEILIESHRDDAEQVKMIIKREMEQAYKLSVPLKVSVGCGTNWNEAH